MLENGALDLEFLALEITNAPEAYVGAQHKVPYSSNY